MYISLKRKYFIHNHIVEVIDRVCCKIRHRVNMIESFILIVDNPHNSAKYPQGNDRNLYQPSSYVQQLFHTFTKPSVCVFGIFFF